jgi:diadenosine tetraphosphate (Ap4A) HIT family hydrolase
LLRQLDMPSAARKQKDGFLSRWALSATAVSTVRAGLSSFADSSERQRDMTEPNSTMVKFGHPETVIGETEYWTVQLRPEQVTLGSLVLISREPVEAFGRVSPEGFAGLQSVIAKIEDMLRDLIAYQKINYLMLMMVDKDVHFHVIPRYDGNRDFRGLSVSDAGWPGPPQLGTAVTPDPRAAVELVEELRNRWSQS